MSPVDPWEDEQFDDSLVDGGDEQGGEGEEPPELYFESLEVFVGWLLDTYRRSTVGPHRIWCPEWWRHPEALARLDALWRAFEHLRLDPALGMSVWWRDHADHHLAVLMDPDGPLKGCNVERGHSDRPLEPLARTPVPDGLLEHESASRRDRAAGGEDDSSWTSTTAADTGGYSAARNLAPTREPHGRSTGR